MLPSHQRKIKIKSKKRLRKYYGNISEEEKIKKRTYANIRNWNMSDADRKRKKDYMKNSYYKGKPLLNHSIKCVQKRKNVSLSKQIFKIRVF